MTVVIVQVMSLPNGDPASLPRQASGGAAGFDIQSVEDVTIQPGALHAVATGLAMAIPEGFEGQVRPRSGLALKHGVTVLNAPGTIDSDYRGEVKVILVNHGREPFQVRRGDRVAQLVVAPVPAVRFERVETLSDSERGVGGFGSTGLNAKTLG
jgi:dUTP pyrophosphatase